MSSSSAAQPGDATSGDGGGHSGGGNSGDGDSPDHLPLSENAEQPATPPAWAFPVLVDGWTFGTYDQKGVNQLERANSDALFTSYQLTETDTEGNDDASDSRAWLEKYHRTLTSSQGLRKVGDPTYSSARIQSDHAMTVEFVQQDVSYETAAGVRYKSRFLARSMGTYLLAVQYGAPEDEWSEAEWQELISSGLQLVLGW